tara:strand:+ start:1404 stop:1937 length:534 start_codon:yes stop_codon:yes gene_type:complete
MFIYTNLTLDKLCLSAYNSVSNGIYTRNIMDVIFDVDGTLMDISQRRKFIDGSMGKKDWNAFRDSENVMQDTPKFEIFALAKAMKAVGHRIIISSGRNKSQRAQTLKQLMMQGLVFDAVYMRSDSDYRPDFVVKADMLTKMKKDGFDPIMAVDDRQQVVDMWRANGLTVLQVDEGNF